MSKHLNYINAQDTRNVKKYKTRRTRVASYIPECPGSVMMIPCGLIQVGILSIGMEYKRIRKSIVHFVG
jgi:hypothetical protein